MDSSVTITHKLYKIEMCTPEILMEESPFKIFHLYPSFHVVECRIESKNKLYEKKSVFDMYKCLWHMHSKVC